MAAQITRTKSYKNLVALGVEPDQAVKLLALKAKKAEEEKAAAKPEVDVTALAKELGVTEAEVKEFLDAAKGDSPVVKKTREAEEVVAEAGLTFSKGRVYANQDVVEGQARVLAGKVGTFEIVPTSGSGHVKAVLITKLETGDVSVQNLALNA